jgi:hypothetical protein
MSKEPKRLEPINDIVLAEPGSSKTVVRQQKQKQLLLLKERVKEAVRTYRNYYDEVKEDLVDGAQVQSGETKLSYGVKYVRRRSYRTDLINYKCPHCKNVVGEAYAITLLNNTRPVAQFYLLVRQTITK